MYVFLADLTAAVHLAYVAFVVLGQFAILVGLALKWRWVRNPWFRWAHLVMICIVALETVAGMTCPLTTWERDLRVLGGQPVDWVWQPDLIASTVGHLGMFQTDEVFVAAYFYGNGRLEMSFTGRLVHNFLFVGPPGWVFSACYITFAVLVVATFWFAPPRARRCAVPGTQSV